MKDGRTHLAHKAGQAVDLETGAIVGVTVQDADAGDTTTSVETLIEAAEQVEAVRPDVNGIEEVVGDEGYHRLLRLRGKRLERPFAHLFETGGMRRVYLRGHTNIRKRLLIHAAGFNLGVLLRQLIAVGTPRGLQGRLVAALGVLLTPICARWRPLTRHWLSRRLAPLSIARYDLAHVGARETAFTMGC